MPHKFVDSAIDEPVIYISLLTLLMMVYYMMGANLSFLILSLISSSFFASVFAISNLLLNSGPSCVVRSIIPGTPNQSTNGMKGTCFSTLTCRQQGGVPIGRCGTTNVCCVFPRTCGGVAAHNSTYFTNPGYPSPFNGSNTCTITIHRVPGVNNICQLRLDFVDFELVRPNGGKCESDRFLVSGQNSNSVIAPICGYNSGQHMYIDVDGAYGPFNLHMITSGGGQRRWNILVSQIECLNPSKAPPNCLQYLMGPEGQITSFNYELGQQLNTNQMVDIPGSGIGYMNNLDYSVCFRKEQGFCSMTYLNANASQSQRENVFGIRNIVGGRELNQDSAGTGIQRCPNDYLLLNGVRLCGYRLNPNAIDPNSNLNIDEEVVDRGTGPFMARFVSNQEYNGRGFKLRYQQNPCGTAPNSPPALVSGIGRRYTTTTESLITAGVSLVVMESTFNSVTVESYG